jgi:hypothetical protein
MELSPEKVLGTVAAVAGAIVAVAGAIYSGGSSLAAAAACIGLLVDINGAVDQSGSQGNIIDDFKNNSSGWVDWNAEGGPKLTKEADKFVGGLEDLVKKSKNIYDKFRTAKELFEAKVDGELQNKEKELLIERIELTMARNIVELKTLQAGFQVSAVKQRNATAEADIQNLKEQAQTLESNIAVLADMARALVRHAQGYADILIKYQFYCARAVDVWTSETEWSKTFSFALGYLHPDVEEHAYLAASRGDSSRILKLLQDYLESWASLPKTVKLRDDYETYSNKLQSHRKSVAITDPTRLDFFRSARTLSVSYDVIPAGDLAPKIKGVYVVLVGATSQFPNVEINVEHPGQALGAPPAMVPIQCTFDITHPLRPFQGNGSFPLLGRDPTAVWRLYLDTDSAADVDLAGLTEIILTIDYLSVPA